MGMTQTIGLLGATGKVGQGAAEMLLDSPNCRVVLGGRNLEQRLRHYKDRWPSASWMEVDVFDDASLHAFCVECDIIVNCAGPAKRIMTRVAHAALLHSAHYVDVAGDERLYRLLMEYCPELMAKRLTFVISAGIYPGLSEVLPAYVAQSYFDKVDRLELFFAGAGDFSFHAAYDIVCSIEENAGHGMACSVDGQVRQISGLFKQQYIFPSPAGKRDSYPVLGFEFLEMSRRRGLGHAYFYNTYPDLNVLGKFMTIRALEQYKTEEQKIASARLLAEQYAGHGDPNGGYACYELLAEGTKNGRHLDFKGQLLYRGDWNRLSGLVAAHTALLLLKHGGTAPGCFLASDGVSPARLIAALGRHDAVFTCTTTGPEVSRE